MVKKMSVGIEPLGKMVLLELEEAAEKTDSGFLLPEAAREKMNVGLVAGVGRRAPHQPPAGKAVRATGQTSRRW
ncbi:MAG: co-chaperone GroES [Candidatus Poseidoniia archaeon]|nr:co-chaperone GroES [Candidatus Poseidoniia archaeon]